MGDLGFWGMVSAGVVVVLVLLVYVAMPVLLSFGDTRVMPGPALDLASGPMAVDGEAMQEEIGARFQEAGEYVEVGARLMLYCDTASGKVWNCYLAFAHKTEPIIAWQGFVFPEDLEGDTRGSISPEAVLLTPFEDGTYLHTTVGLTPEIPSTEKVVPLWWRGETIKGATQKHIEWMKASGRVPKTIVAEEAPNMVAQYRADMVTEGIKSGTVVSLNDGTRYRVSVPNVIWMVWHSIPPGIWFRRNQEPGK